MNSSASLPSDELMTVLLDDLRRVTVRVVRPSDAGPLQRLHSRLSERTNRLRFFAVVPELSARDAAHFACVDHDDREAIVAEVDDEIVAVVRYDRTDLLHCAEIALLVRDDYQHHRLGVILLAELVSLARQRGITHVVAETLPENSAVLHAMRAVGLDCTTRYSDGVCTITGEFAA